MDPRRVDIGEKSFKNTEKKEEQIKKLKERFPQAWESLLEGNRIADKWAKKGAVMDKGERVVPPEADKVAIIRGGELTEMKVTRLLTDEWNKKYINDTNNASGISSLDNFSTRESNLILMSRKKEDLKYQSKLVRMRTNNLYLPKIYSLETQIERTR